MSAELRIEDDGAVRILTIDRTDRGNSLAPQTSAAIIDALLDADQDAAVRAIVITGAGERFFCTGADMRAYGESKAPIRCRVHNDRCSSW